MRVPTSTVGTHVPGSAFAEPLRSWDGQLTAPGFVPILVTQAPHDRDPLAHRLVRSRDRLPRHAHSEYTADSLEGERIFRILLADHRAISCRATPDRQPASPRGPELGDAEAAPNPGVTGRDNGARPRMLVVRLHCRGHLQHLVLGQAGHRCHVGHARLPLGEVPVLSNRTASTVCIGSRDHPVFHQHTALRARCSAPFSAVTTAIRRTSSARRLSADWPRRAQNSNARRSGRARCCALLSLIRDARPDCPAGLVRQSIGWRQWASRVGGREDRSAGPCRQPSSTERSPADFRPRSFRGRCRWVAIVARPDPRPAQRRVSADWALAGGNRWSSRG